MNRLVVYLCTFVMVIMFGVSMFLASEVERLQEELAFAEGSLKVAWGYVENTK